MSCICFTAIRLNGYPIRRVDVRECSPVPLWWVMTLSRSLPTHLKNHLERPGDVGFMCSVWLKIPGGIHVIAVLFATMTPQIARSMARPEGG